MSVSNFDPKREHLLKSLGDELQVALQNRETISPLSERGYDLSVSDAYTIQQHMIKQRLAEGEKVVGKKIGVTAKIVQEMMGVTQPDFGWLLSGMVYNEGDAVPMSSLIQPKVEGEIAFLLKKDLCGPGISAKDVIDATEGVLACIEIVDSRIANWQLRIDDTISDNASCGALVLGDRLVPITDLDLPRLGMVMERNGDVVATGAGAASLGSPIAAVAWLANTLGEFGISLNAGEVILSGSLGPLVDVSRGDSIRCEVSQLGSCSVKFN